MLGADSGDDKMLAALFADDDGAADAVPAPAPRGAALANLDHLAPFGCTLRKYSRKNGSEYVVGILKPGEVAADGTHSQTVSWSGPRSRVASEEDAIAKKLRFKSKERI